MKYYLYQCGSEIAQIADAIMRLQAKRAPGAGCGWARGPYTKDAIEKELIRIRPAQEYRDEKLSFVKFRLNEQKQVTDILSGSSLDSGLVMSSTQFDELFPRETDTLTYKIAVMTAAANGAAIETRAKSSKGSFVPLYVPGALWDWASSDYRIAVPAPCSCQVAPGHNPDKLTFAQVGEGYRLLSTEEWNHIHSQNGSGETLDMWSNHTRWIAGGNGYCVSVTYRTNKPAGYFLPKPKKIVPREAADYPAMFWVRLKDVIIIDSAHLVTSISENGVFTGAGGNGVNWASLAEHYEYSADRKNWSPCTKEVEQNA